MTLTMNQTVMDWPTHLQPQSFLGPDRLSHASEKGAKAAEIIEHFQVLDRLAQYDPVIAGTLPIALDTPESDVDILCHVSDLMAFKTFSDQTFSDLDKYRVHMRAPTDHLSEAVVVRFECDGLPIEVFATDYPTITQYGFVHMLVEARILWLMGDDFSQDVMALKQDGVKTEPAFAQMLGLVGDPYIALAELAALSPTELRTRLKMI